MESEIRGATINMNSEFLQALAQDGAINYDSITEEKLDFTFGELTTQINDSTDRQESLLANLQAWDLNLYSTQCLLIIYNQTVLRQVPIDT